MATDYSGLDAENEMNTDTAFVPESEQDTNKLILSELRTQTALLREFVQAINQVGDMFSGGDGGKPVSPMSMISKALFH